MQMLNRNGPNLGMPLFFKLWFAFVGTIVLTITGGMFYFLKASCARSL
jgi:hypothetical protein